MDRCNSQTNNTRSTQSDQTNYQKLTLRSTPKVTESRSTIQIPTKTTFTNSVITETSYQIRKEDWVDITSPTRQYVNSPILHVPNSPGMIDLTKQNITESQVTQSYLSPSSTHDWQKQCKMLIQTIQQQKMTIKQLETANLRVQQQLSESIIRNECLQDSHLKQKLQETQQRMGQQNAYLRDCMFKLHEQIDHLKTVNMSKIQKQNETLKQQNNHLILQIMSKNKDIQFHSTNNKKLQEQLFLEKATNKQYQQKLQQNQHKIKDLIDQNKELLFQIDNIKQINIQLSSKVMQQQQQKKQLVHDNSSIKRDMQNHKQIAQQLKSSMKKLRQENSSLNKSIQSITPKHIFRSNKNETSLTKVTSKNKSMNRIPTENNISNEEDKFGFDLSSYMNKIQEFQILKDRYLVKKQFNDQLCSKLLSLTEYFSCGLDQVMNDRMKDKQAIEKYKRLVQITVKSPKSQVKASEYITQLIQKCNLLESSLQQKKSTILKLTQQLQQNKKTDNELKIMRHYKSQVYDTSKESDNEINIKPETQIKNNQSLNKGLLNILQKHRNNIRVGNLSEQRQNNHNSKYKNRLLNTSYQTQGDQQQTQKKRISVIQQQQLYTNKQGQDQTKIQNQIESKNHRLWSQSIEKRKQRTIGLSQPFEQNKLLRSTTTDFGPKKKRLDQLIKNKLSSQTILSLILKLSQIASTMSKNNNFATILPDSVYILNYSQSNTTNLKLKVLQTTKSISQIKQYWAPQNINGQPFNQLSLVWNIGIIFKSFSDDTQSMSQSSLLKQILQQMLETHIQKRCKLKFLQQTIITKTKHFY